jgi:hypothetical protein
MKQCELHDNFSVCATKNNTIEQLRRHTHCWLQSSGQLRCLIWSSNSNTAFCVTAWSCVGRSLTLIPTTCPVHTIVLVVFRSLIWLGLRTNGVLLWTRSWAFGLHKILGNSSVSDQLLSFQGGLSYMEWVIAMKYFRRLSREVELQNGARQRKTLKIFPI